EALFDFYFTSELARVELAGGVVRSLGGRGVIAGFDLSPDGRFVLVERLHRPYNYVVPSSEFPIEIAVLDAATGKTVRKLVDRPLADDLPIAF
ncbi:hypothetical protein, partial [Enterococcus faecium]